MERRRERWQRTRCWSGWAWSARKYFLYVSRMEPENNALLVREILREAGDAA